MERVRYWSQPCRISIPDCVLVSESYITHIRIEEDSAFPSTPPPQDSPLDKKKPRVIIVAVRKSGRVRMHKAKENANGTFSIGKTWVLDDLTAIQSFTNALPRTPEEQMDKQRAGSTGFIVTIQKPYYWNSHTAKEKDFFIFSLIKIFKKYTGGRLPTLIGFTPAELEQLGGGTGTPNGNLSISQSGPTSRPAASMSSQEPVGIRDPRAPNLPPEASRERRPHPSQERSSQERPGQRRPSQGPPSQDRPTQRRPSRGPPSQDRPSQRRPSQEPPSQDRQLHSAVSHPVRVANSNDRIHMPGSFPSTDSVNDPNQQPQLRNKRSESPAVLQQPNFRRPGPAQSTESFRSGQESFESGGSSNERPRPNVSYSSSSLAVNAVEDRPLNTVKDPRGPSPLSQGHELSEPAPVLNFNPPPTGGTNDKTNPRVVEDKRNGHRREHSASSKSSNRGARGPVAPHGSEPDGIHAADETRPTAASSHDERPLEVAPQLTPSSMPPVNNGDASVPQPTATKFPPTPPPETPTEEVHRPGLGPMIKTKKSTNEVASKFRKAATAYNAFKPKTGGAAEKLKDDNSTGGDGITGVFQAPSLLRAATQDDSRPSTPKDTNDTRPATPETKKEVLPVNVTISPQKPVSPVPAEPVAPAHVEPQKPPPIPDKADEERHKKRQSDHSARYAKILGINPSLLEGRASEIDAVLSDFGWGEDRNQKMVFEELEGGLRKELARVEAGSWLGAVENNDDRAVAVGGMMDRVIAECEELDCLLTLYNVELGAS